MLDSLDTLIAFVVIMLVVSMLITIAVQILAAAMNLRGINLARGLTHTFDTILPGFEGQAKVFVDRILGGRLLSDSGARRLFGKRKATAVRPDEIFDALHRIATQRNPRFADLAESARSLLRGLGVSDAVLARAAAEVAITTGQQLPEMVGTVEKMLGAARQSLAGLPVAQRAAVEAAIKPLADRLNSLETRTVAEAAEVAQALDQACRKFKYWFEVSQERAQQWFTTHTRWFTVLFAILFAFGLQLDTVEIFKFVSSNKAARDKLVAQVGAVTGQAEKIVGDGRTVLQTALDKWRSALTDDPAKQAVASAEIKPADTRGSVRAKIDVALGTNRAKAELLESFDKAVDAAAEEKLKESAADYASLRTRLDDTGFKLFVTDPGGRWHHGWGKDLLPHLLGMLFSVGLLSLGAPFWFNVLKSLANLRSRVAQSISTEQEGEKPAPGKTAAPRPATDRAAPPAAPTVAPATVMPSH